MTQRGYSQMLAWEQVWQEMKGYQRKKKEIRSNSLAGPLIRVIQYLPVIFNSFPQDRSCSLSADICVCLHTHSHVSLRLLWPFTQPLQLPVWITVCSKKPAVSCSFARTYGTYTQTTEMHIYEILNLCMYIQVRNQAVRVEYENSDLIYSCL